MPMLQPSTTNPRPANAFDQEAVAATAVLPSNALEQARAADHLWREARRTQVEKQLRQGRWLHQWLINPLITVSSIFLMTQLIPLVHRPGGIGVDLTSDWALSQWCIRYLVFLVLMFFPPVSIHRWVSRRFANWEARLRQELGQPDDD